MRRDGCQSSGSGQGCAVSGVVRLVWGHQRRLHCRSCSCFCRLRWGWGRFGGVESHWGVLSREATGSKWCVRKMILALRLSLKRTTTKKDFAMVEELWTQDARMKLPSRLADLAAWPLLLPYMAPGSATQAWASLICSLPPLSLLEVSSLPFHLS